MTTRSLRCRRLKCLTQTPISCSTLYAHYRQELNEFDSCFGCRCLFLAHAYEYLFFTIPKLNVVLVGAWWYFLTLMYDCRVETLSPCFFYFLALEFSFRRRLVSVSLAEPEYVGKSFVSVTLQLCTVHSSGTVGLAS